MHTEMVCTIIYMQCHGLHIPVLLAAAPQCGNTCSYIFRQGKLVVLCCGTICAQILNTFKIPPTNIIQTKVYPWLVSQSLRKSSCYDMQWGSSKFWLILRTYHGSIFFSKTISRPFSSPSCHFHVSPASCFLNTGVITAILRAFGGRVDNDPWCIIIDRFNHNSNSKFCRRLTANSSICDSNHNLPC